MVDVVGNHNRQCPEGFWLRFELAEIAPQHTRIPQGLEAESYYSRYLMRLTDSSYTSRVIRRLRHINVAKSTSSRPWSPWFGLLVICTLFIPPCAQSQQDAANKRRLVERSAPAYPTLARSMALQGIVRVEAVVSTDGSVKAVDVKGGHPVLAQAAVNAVRKWRWEAAPHESREAVEVKFSPE